MAWKSPPQHFLFLTTILSLDAFYLYLLLAFQNCFHMNLYGYHFCRRQKHVAFH